jgi:nitroreductase
LELWDSNGYPTTDYEYQLALSSLLAYETKHKQLHSALPAHFTDLFSQRLSQILAVSSELSGAVKSASADSRQRSFYSVIEERHSTREFGAEKVDRATLLDCIKLAVCSPSVCNRQPARVMVLNNPSIIQKALDIQGGWKGFEYPQTLLLVLSDMSSFTTYVEHHEPYVDGGIFSMTLLAAFEDRKVKACPLNTMFTKMQENKIRQLLSVSDDFAFIMFIAIGTEKEGVLHPMSKRKNVETLLWEK